MPVEAIGQGVTGSTAASPASACAPLLSLEAVTLVRSRGCEPPQVVLDAVSLGVEPGELVAIRGERRAGKTALLRVAAGYELPQRGTVRVGGAPITGVSGGRRACRARAIAYVPKRPRIAGGRCVTDHLVLPLLATRVPLTTAMARAHEALESVGAGALADAAPRELTAAEQCRVALARALVARPSVVLVDEPGVTADADERERLLCLLRAVARERPGLALVVTTRDDDGLAGATRVLTLDEGRLCEVSGGARVIPLPVRGRGGDDR